MNTYNDIGIVYGAYGSDCHLDYNYYSDEHNEGTGERENDDEEFNG